MYTINIIIHIQAHRDASIKVSAVSCRNISDLTLSFHQYNSKCIH